MTINYSKQVLLKRGNTAVSTTYTGPIGEITLDTDLLQLRVHDGTTQGGWVIPSGQDFIDIQTDLAIIANVDTSLLANVSTLLANANSQQTQIDSLLTSVADFVTIGNIEPATANETFWFNDGDGRLYIKQADVWTDASPSVLPSPAYIFSTLENTAGNIIPDASNVYSLGSSVSQWKDLWVSNATIYLNSVPLGVDATGNLTYDGNPLVSYVDGNLSVGGEVVSGGGGNPFDQTLNTNSAVSFASVDATVGYIAQINGSNPGNELVIQTGGIHNFNFYSNAALGLPYSSRLVTFDTGSVELTAGNNANGYTNYASLASFNANTYMWVDNDAAYIGTNWTSEPKTWTFGTNGTITVPLQPGSASNQIKYGMGNLVAYNDNGWTLGEYNGDNFGMTGMRINPGIEGYADLYMPSDTAATTDPVRLSNYFQYGNVALRANNKEWKFDHDGILTLASRGAQAYSMILGDELLIGGESQPGVPSATLLFLPRNNNAGVDAVSLRNGLGNVEISTDSGNWTWKFGNNGKLTTPGETWLQSGDDYRSIVFSPDSSTPYGYIKVDGGGNMVVSANGTYYVKVEDNDRLAISPTSTTIKSAVNTVIQTNAFGTSQSFTFGADGSLTIPGTTNSINNTTGALTVAGGLGVSQDVHIGGTLQITDTTPSNDYTTGALVVNGGVGVNGNINITGNINILSGNINIQEFTGSTGNFFGDITTGFNAFYAGKSGFTPLPYTVAQFSTNSNSYSQINMENISTGKLASVDFVGTGDIGDDANWFFDIGFTNSGYDPALAAENNALGTVVGPLDAYYYVQGNASVPGTGGNLAIGTSQANKVVKLFAGGVNAANVVATVAETGLTINRGILTFSDGSSMSAAYGNVQVVNRLNNGITINNGPINFTASPPAYSSPGIQWSDGFQDGIYGNVQMLANIATATVITALQSNIAAANASIVTANAAMKSYVDAADAALASNAAAQANQISAANAAIVTANSAVVSYVNTLNSAITANVTAANAAIVTANTAMKGYVDAQIASVPSGGSTYSNTNVASYLTTASISTTGNISAANLSGNISITGNVTGTSPNVSLVAGSYTYTFDNAGSFTLPANSTIKFANGVNILSTVAGGGSTYGDSNVATYLTGNIVVGNVRSTSGYFWANGLAYAGTYGNTQVAQYLTGTIAVGNINLGTAMRINGTTQTIDTANGSSINLGSRVNFTGSAAGLGMNVSFPATFASNVLVQGSAGVTMPNRPAFRIYGGTPAWWTTANTNFKGTSIVVDYNQGNYFNSTTGVFTAPVAGLYHTTLNARIGSLNAQGQVMVIKNGLTTPGNVAVMWETDTNTGTAVHFGVTSVIKLAAGDVLTANITAGNIQFDANDSWTVTYIG